MYMCDPVGPVYQTVHFGVVVTALGQLNACWKSSEFCAIPITLNYKQVYINLTTLINKYRVLINWVDKLLI